MQGGQKIEIHHGGWKVANEIDHGGWIGEIHPIKEGGWETMRFIMEDGQKIDPSLRVERQMRFMMEGGQEIMRFIIEVRQEIM